MKKVKIQTIYLGKSVSVFHQLCDCKGLDIKWLKSSIHLGAIPKETRIVILHLGGPLSHQIYQLEQVKLKMRQTKARLIVMGDVPYLRIYIEKGAQEVFSADTSICRITKRALSVAKIESSHTKHGEKHSLNYKPSLVKRFFDLIFAGSALILLSPLFVFISLLIRLESKGPALYSSKRVGAGYKVFEFYKFRSMYMNADQRLLELKSKNQYQLDKEVKRETLPKDIAIGSIKLLSDDGLVEEETYRLKKRDTQQKAFFKLNNDPRITKVGRFIRNTSIDELPQLLNVLKGDMSIVGNRPLPLYEAEKLTSDRWIKRFLAPAGLTGLWQVTKRAKTKDMSPSERKQLDVDYAEKNSFFNDIKIILKTLPAMVQHENV